MANLHDRMARAVASIATATSVQRTRSNEAARAARGASAAVRVEGMEAAVTQLETAAAGLWSALGEQEPPALSRAA